MTKISILTNRLKPAETYTHTHTHTSKFLQIIFATIFVIVSIISTPIFADDNPVAIPAGATNVLCNESVLGTATGPVKLRARFVPENIDLKWYDGNTQVNVSSSSNTCEYDTGINLPTTPTKTGYEFKGWKVTPQYDFSTLRTDLHSINASRYAKDESVGALCRAGGTIVTCNSSFEDLNIREWKVPFSFGTIYGNSQCSDTNDGKSGSQVGNPGTAQRGKYCWCMATGYKPSDSNVIYRPSNNPSWVFYYDYGDMYSCLGTCANGCATSVTFSAGFRQTIFGQSGS